jgi:Cu/Zn superoxide dismutase
MRYAVNYLCAADELSSGWIFILSAQTSIPIDRTQPCSDHAIGGHFNPFNVTKPPVRGTPDQYEVGDLSGKFNKLRDLHEFEQSYNDTNMELVAPHSVIGRSIVIHKKDGSR